eukprot:14681.XXX_328319_328429_1 [CDS] Oithona nana genome sequencing.
MVRRRLNSVDPDLCLHLVRLVALRHLLALKRSCCQC